MSKKYNGWSNYWTHNTFTWITSYENTYRYFEELAENYPFSRFKEEVEAFIKIGSIDAESLEEIREAIDTVNYKEIRDGLLGD